MAADKETRDAVMGMLLNGKTGLTEAKQITEKQNKSVDNDDSILTQLSALEHEQWMSWAKDILKTEEITAERAERWQKLFVPYEELSAEKKELDKEYARKVLDIARSVIINTMTPDKNESMPVTDLSASLNKVIESQQNIMSAQDTTEDVQAAIKKQLGTIVDFSIMEGIF